MALSHEVDFDRFRPLTVEQTYYALRFFLGWTAESDASYLGLPPSAIPWERAVAYVNARHRQSTEVDVESLRDAFTHLVELFSDVCPSVKYSFWCQMLPDAWFTFMNYGYDDSKGAPAHFDDVERLWRDAACLYERTAAVELSGRSVLEVGSGRGGGAALLARTRSPREYVGLDATQSNVLFCRATHALSNLAFEHGLSTDLPWPDERFDVLLNVESSFYYRPLSRFAEEAYRVLRPNGAVCLATYGPPQELRSLCDGFTRVGFALIEDEDITPSVAQALRRMDQGKLVLDRVQTQRDAGIYRRCFESIYTVPPLLDGSNAYVRYVFEKVGPS
jgi:SAM-dependent methyltransferase